MKTAWVKRGRGLIAASESAEDWIRRRKEGQSVIGELKNVGQRNLRQFRLLFALLGVLVDHDCFPAIKAALAALKIGLGHVDYVTMPDDGEIFLEPKSIAFENMDADEFGVFLNDAIALVCRRWMQGVENDALFAEICNIVDGPEKSSLGKRVRK